MREPITKTGTFERIEAAVLPLSASNEQEKVAHDFAREVRAAFAFGGCLARPLANGDDNAAQSAMAEAVAETLATNGVLAVEAGTGVGKTWAYLAPLLISGQRAWLSTATQALQEQLFQRDIPALSRALGMPVKAALLKGRSNYVCVRRLEMAQAGELKTGFSGPAWLSALERVRRWASQSVDGDLAELPGLEDQSPMRPWISSTRENCMGEACPRFTSCHVFRARREAIQADWVVINHHLFLASHWGSDDDLPALLPPTQTVVFDEAHRLVELGETQLGLSMGSEQLMELARELKSLGPMLARGLQPWAHCALLLEQSARSVSNALQLTQSAGKVQMPWAKRAPQGVDLAIWQRVRREVLAALDKASACLQAVADAAAPLAGLAERAQRWRSDWVVLLQDRADGDEQPGQAVRWVERWPEGGWRVVQSAADAAQAFQAAMASAGPVNSWVFTSATLGTDERLSWFTEALGLQAHPTLRTLRIASPFDHAAQASLYVPDGLPEPADEQHSLALAVAVARWAAVLGGRTLVLTTSLRACERIAAALGAHLAAD
ncbi:MAG: ATP-dependent DNA helicase, partial [Hydrogenophaga sp.]